MTPSSVSRSMRSNGALVIDAAAGAERIGHRHLDPDATDGANGEEGRRWLAVHLDILIASGASAKPGSRHAAARWHARSSPRIVRPASNRVSEETCREKSRSRIISRPTATLGDSQLFGAHVWSELGPRLLDFQDKRLRLMDAAGVEIMIASLNAPAIQAHPRDQAGGGGGARGERRTGAGNREAPRSLRRRCGAGDAGPGQRGGGARTLHRGSRLQRRAGQRVLASGVGRHRGVLRSAAVSTVLARGRATRRSILSASAQSVAGLGPRLRGPRLAARAELGVRMPRPRCTRCG